MNILAPHTVETCVVVDGAPSREFEAILRIEERFGRTRVNEPIRVGIPFPRGFICDPSEITVWAQSSRTVPYQGRTLAFWPDRSVKWMLIDALASVETNQCAVLSVHRKASTAKGRHSDSAVHALRVTDEVNRLVVNTGVAQFCIARDSFGPLSAVQLGATELLATGGSDIQLFAADGKEHKAVVNCVRLEDSGPVRASILIEGGFGYRRRRIPLLFKARLVFFAGSARVRVEFQIRNPRAAHHPGGLWDLGDAGSFRFTDLSIRLHPRTKVTQVHWYAEDPGRCQLASYSDFNLYQDSSGGENWDSPNHVDFAGKPTVSFRGYQVKAGLTGEPKLVGAGRRATPSLQVSNESAWIAATVEDFWQNFPKALRLDEGMLSIGLFPSECKAGFELQGGEQKRHILFLDFGLHDCESVIPCMQNALAVSVDPLWIEQSAAIPWFVGAEDEGDERYSKYIDNIVEGPNSFFSKREVVDEYGWRNFGDLYADHEAIHHCGQKPMVSHYNNQYDFICGALVQFLRTGDPRWQRLMEDAAKHTIDIDIYHTTEDRAAYNGGLFWHTDHYKDASTCSHRTYSRHNGSDAYGGGPSNEHNYTSGLLHYYYLSGDLEAAEAVVELANWVIAMDDGSRSLFGLLDAGPTGLATKTTSADYHGPGRGAGNSINALLDAYALVNDRRYFSKAEELLQRCIHPEDNIVALKLNEPEYRWSYLAFLQVLGKYLETKVEFGERDYYFHYARESLLQYAAWMAQNEVPYKDVLHKVLIPTETWPAHDIRKCHVFHVAAKYGPSTKQAIFREKAQFFFDSCLTDVLSFGTAFVTRPLVILCTYGYVQAYFQESQHVDSGAISQAYDFGRIEPFLPQRTRIRKTLSKKLRMATTEIRHLSTNTWSQLKNRLGKKGRCP